MRSLGIRRAKDALFFFFSHHEQVRVELLKVTQAVHGRAGGVVVRQNDDVVVVFGGRRTLLPFDVAGHTRGRLVQLIWDDKKNFFVAAFLPRTE